MKKYFAAIVLSLLCLAGVSAVERMICCTTYPVWLLTRELTAGAKNVRTELMIPAGTGCPHQYVLTPRDMRKLGAKNLLVVRNGGGLDDFVLKPLAKVNPRAPVIPAVRVYPPPTASFCPRCLESGGGLFAPGSQLRRQGANPHYFASPDTAALMVENIAFGLCRHDPANAEIYRKNRQELLGKLEGLMKEIRALKPSVAGKAVAVQHGIFEYLAAALGLKIAGELSKEGAALSAGELRKLVRVMRKNRVAAIFAEVQSSARTAEMLGRECAIPVCELDPLASGPAHPGTDYYIKVMRANLANIRSALVK